MLGLEVLQHTIKNSPVSIPEKVLFIIENLPRAQKLTSLISFGSLGSLLVIRKLKALIVTYGGKWKYMKYLPEVFVVVLVTTSKVSLHVMGDKSEIESNY